MDQWFDQTATLVHGDQVITAERTGAGFASYMPGVGLPSRGAEVVGTRPVNTPPRLVHDPGHPYADERGFVSYPGINPVSEMVGLMEAARAYEANVRALNAAKSMALRALEIGRQS